MSTSGNGSEPSMEEILASIRALVSQDPAHQQAAQSSATPAMPHLVQQPPASEPGAAGPVRPDRLQPSPPPGAGPALSGPAAHAPQNAQSAPARPDEDDLADLLDEPLPATTPNPASVTGPASLKTGWNASGAPSAAGAEAAGDGRAANASGNAGAAISFDFGSMIPTRDPDPRATGAGATPMPALSRFPSLGLKPEPATKAPSPVRPASESKPAAIGPDRLPHPVAGKPAVDVGTRSDSGAGEFQGPGRYFPSPLTGNSGLSDTKGTSEPVPDEKKPATANAADANASADAAAMRAGREDAPSSPTPVDRSGASTQVSAAEREAASSYPSTEPFFPAFGKTDTRAEDRLSLGPTAKSLTVSEANADPVADLAKSSSAVTAVGPTAEASETPALRLRDGGGGRTLEEAVMELLRPILREWVDKNLPRIVEDAVRREVSNAIKNKADLASKV